jgi:hypothetical protein
MVLRSIVTIAAFLIASSASAEELCPKYGECVPADQFECTEIDRSSVVTRVCYNAPNGYMIIRLKTVDYHYCAIDTGTVAKLLAAESMGRFYNQNIKSAATDRRFDCRDHAVPTF